MSDDMPLREYVQHIYRELQGEMDRRVESQQRAAEQVAADLNKRLEGMNEFRAAMGDLSSSRVSRELFDEHVSSYDARIRGIEERLAEIKTTTEARADAEAEIRKGEQSVLQRRVVITGLVISALVIIVNIVIALIAHIQFR